MRTCVTLTRLIFNYVNKEQIHFRSSSNLKVEFNAWKGKFAERHLGFSSCSCTARKQTVTLWTHYDKQEHRSFGFDDGLKIAEGCENTSERRWSGLMGVDEIFWEEEWQKSPFTAASRTVCECARECESETAALLKAKEQRAAPAASINQWKAPFSTALITASAALLGPDRRLSRHSQPNPLTGRCLPLPHNRLIPNQPQCHS